jgi:hypothetical protein
MNTTHYEDYLLYDYDYELCISPFSTNHTIQYFSRGGAAPTCGRDPGVAPEPRDLLPQAGRRLRGLHAHQGPGAHRPTGVHSQGRLYNTRHIEEKSTLFGIRPSSIFHTSQILR